MPGPGDSDDQGCSLRTADLAVRYGGEALKVSLPDTYLLGACKLTDGVVQALGDLRIPQTGYTVGIVNASPGVACGIPATRHARPKQ